MEWLLLPPSVPRSVMLYLTCATALPCTAKLKRTQSSTSRASGLRFLVVTRIVMASLRIECLVTRHLTCSASLIFKCAIRSKIGSFIQKHSAESSEYDLAALASYSAAVGTARNPCVLLFESTYQPTVSPPGSMPRAAVAFAPGKSIFVYVPTAVRRKPMEPT